MSELHSFQSQKSLRNWDCSRAARADECVESGTMLHDGVCCLLGCARSHFALKDLSAKTER